MAAGGVFLLAACAGNAGAEDGVKDLCALADLPAETPAEIEALKARVDAFLQDGSTVENSEHGKRVFKAAMSVRQSAESAQFVARASPGAQATLASEFLKDFGAGSGYILNDLPRAQAELRDACG